MTSIARCQCFLAAGTILREIQKVMVARYRKPRRTVDDPEYPATKTNQHDNIGGILTAGYDSGYKA